MKAEDVPFAPTKIVVDTYESDDIHRYLVEWGLALPDKYPLPFGDYWVHKRNGMVVPIERKWTDLAGDWPRHLRVQLDKCEVGARTLNNCTFEEQDVVLLKEGILNTDEDTGRLLIGRRRLRKVWYDQVESTILGWQETRHLRVYQCNEGAIHVARAVKAIFRHYRRA